MEERLRELWDYYVGRADRQDQTVIVELLREVQEICGCVPSISSGKPRASAACLKALSPLS